MFNLNLFDKSFSSTLIDAVWQKGSIVLGYDSATWRKDACGALIW